MHRRGEPVWLCYVQYLLPALASLFLCALPARCQDSSDQGVLYLRKSDWAHAQTVLEKSSQIEANQPRVLAALGMALCNQKKYEAAIPPLEKSLQLEPTTGWETEWALAKSYYYREQYEQALKMVQQAQVDSRGAAPQVDLLLAQCLTL